MTLTWNHFLAALKQPLIILLAIALQFVFMPLMALAISIALQLPEAQMTGMILVGCSAGGTASNVICYLAGGNVALSILMTMASTLSAIILMPALTYLYLHQSMPVPVFDMIFSITKIVLIPVLAGTAIHSFMGKGQTRIDAVFPVLSAFAIALIIAIIVSLNQQNLTDLKLPLFLAVALHNISGLLAGYIIPRLMRFDAKICRTISIEVGMQNSGLSVALAVHYFSVGAALPGALFSLWHNFSGSILAAYWRKFDA